MAICQTCSKILHNGEPIGVTRHSPTTLSTIRMIIVVSCSFNDDILSHHGYHGCCSLWSGKKMRWRVAMLNLVDSGLIQPVRDQVSSLGYSGFLAYPGPMKRCGKVGYRQVMEAFATIVFGTTSMIYTPNKTLVLKWV